MAKAIEVGDLTRFLARTTQAIASGARLKGGASIEWDSAPYCSGDIVVQQTCRFTSGKQRLGSALTSDPAQLDRTIFLDQKVPCRRCVHCLRRRAAEWRHRATAECRSSSRTWFVTLTLDPQHQWIASIGTPPDATQEQAFAHSVKGSNREITRFLKRIRKNSGAALRYILVAEAHKSGLPHFHMLLHEDGDEVSKRCIQAAWTWGFITAKLADPKAAPYVTKYLSKSMLARVRASIDYGSFIYKRTVSVSPLDILNERM